MRFENVMWARGGGGIIAKLEKRKSLNLICYIFGLKRSFCPRHSLFEALIIALLLTWISTTELPCNFFSMKYSWNVAMNILKWWLVASLQWEKWHFFFCYSSLEYLLMDKNCRENTASFRKSPLDFKEHFFSCMEPHDLVGFELLWKLLWGVAGIAVWLSASIPRGIDFDPCPRRTRHLYPALMRSDLLGS